MLKKEISATFAGSVVSTGLSIGTAIIMARFLGPANRGLLALALLIPSITATFCRFGQDSVNATFAGLYKDKRSGLFLQSIIITTIGGLISILIVLAFFFWLPIEKGRFGQLSPTIVYLACLVAPISIMGALMGSLVRGVGRIISGAKIRIAQAAFRFALVALFIALLGYRLRFATFLAVLSPLAGVGLSICILRPYATLRLSSFSPTLFRKSMAFGGIVSLSTVAGFLVYRVDQGMLAYMVSAEQVGLYVVAVAFAERMRMLPGAISSAFLPRLANELDARQGQVPEMFRYTMVVSFGAMLIVAVLGAPAILLLFGWEYAGSILPFVLLLPGVAALGGSSILASDMLARQKPQYSLAIGWTLLGVNIILNLALIPVLGISGAALASTACYSLALILRLFIYRRLSGTPLLEMMPRWPDVEYVWANGMASLGQITRRLLGRP